MIAPLPRRVVLFDIDGTLVAGGPAKDAFMAAMLETYGTTGDVETVSFAGKTDPQIARELLLREGFSPERIEEGFPSLWEGYTRRLAEALVHRPMEVLPGVVELLDALGELPDVGLGLLTGNIRRGAELKLGSAGLWDRFATGGFGSDAEDRDALPAVALQRARSVWHDGITPADAVIVGDTPRDVTCGLRSGIRTLAVATGRFGVDDLRASGAHRVVPDLRDTEALVSWISGEGGAARAPA